MELYDGWPYPRGGKLCGRCLRWRTFECFNKHRKRSDGLQYWCSECMAQTNKEWFQRNAAYRNAYMNARSACLSDSYVHKRLRSQDIPPLPDLVEVKRLQLQLHRRTRGPAHQQPQG